MTMDIGRADLENIMPDKVVPSLDSTMWVHARLKFGLVETTPR